MDRTRLTITLKKDLLPKVDAVIDGERIRNRSHAIEYLLTKSLGSKIKKVLILAGGRGIKMRPFTYEVPKTLIPVHDKPILEHTIERLKNSGLRDILIHVGHLGEKIEKHFGDGSDFGVNITYLREPKPQGTAAPLRQAKPYLEKDNFLLIYGDTLSQVDYLGLIDFHLNHKQVATMTVTSSSEPHEWGVLKLSGNKITSFIEKPESQRGISHFINAGTYVLKPEVFKFIPESGYSMLEKDVFPKLAKQGKLMGYPFEGLWFDVSTPEIYEAALKDWPK